MADAGIYLKAALRLWAFEMRQPQESWLLSDDEMRTLHWQLVADGQIDPEPEGWIEDPRLKDWQYEVLNDDTTLGFAEWKAHQDELDK